MKFKDIIQIVITSVLSTNKIRSAFTMLGVTIGVVLIVGGSIVLQSFIEKNVRELETLGGSEFWIVSKMKLAATIGLKMELFTSEITMDDVKALMRQCPLIKELVPINQIEAIIKYKDKDLAFTIRGTSPPYISARDAKLMLGRFFTDSEMLLGSRVCVIEKSKDIDPFFNKNSVGDRIIINGYPFKIIGFIETPTEQTRPGETFLLYIPLSTMKNVFGIRTTNLVIGKAINAENVTKASEQAEKVLLQRYGYPLKFSILNFGKMLEQINRTKSYGQRIVYAIAILSLLAGGIGVMNIMYVSMLERIREIGLAKALGAKKRYIMDQFLLEAIFICVIGGIIGIFIGLTSSFIITLLMGLDYKIPIWALIAGFVLPVIVGVISGFYPARAAAELNPIEALRYE